MTKHFLSNKNTQDIGNIERRWNDLYICGSIYVERVFIDDQEYPIPPYVWPGVKYEDEAFIFTLNIAAGSLTFYLPLNGHSVIGIQDVPYNWLIDWGDGTTETKSGLSSSATTNYITHSYLSAGKKTVTIKPIFADFQWMRAYGFTQVQTGNANANTNKQKIISFDYVTNISFMESPISFGDYYLYCLACGTGVTYPINEVKTIKEDNIKTIGHFWRASEYQYCASLVGALATEYLPNGITTIGDNFRSGQYGGCSKLNQTTPEVLPNGVLSVGNAFRSYQYSNCTALPGYPEVEVFPNSIISIGNEFRAYQYQNDSNILVHGHIHVRMDEILNTYTNNYFRMFYVGSAKATADTIPKYQDKNGNTYNISNLTPTSPSREYCTSRTGIAGYAGLNANWK